MRKKFEKSCLKIWRGGVRIVYLQRSFKEEGDIIIGCASDYALMQFAPAADGGSSDSSGNMRL